MSTSFFRATPLRQKGMSLIEILIVLGIIAAMMTAVVSRPKRSQKDYTRFFRRFSLMSKRIRNQAMIENSTYRMVFRMTDGEPTQMWVEKTRKAVLLGDEKDEEEKFRDMLEDAKSKEVKKKKKTKRPDGFTKVPKFTFESLNIPKDLKLMKVEISGIAEPLENSGLIAFHYFPQGLVEETSMQFSVPETELEWTIVTEAINGGIIVINGLRELKELQDR
jgi:prepilin-type N-terminal cleavage/methylation domain-containing protein